MPGIKFRETIKRNEIQRIARGMFREAAAVTERYAEKIQKTAQALVDIGGAMEAYETGEMLEGIEVQRATRSYRSFDIVAKAEHSSYVHEGKGWHKKARPYLTAAVDMNWPQFIKDISEL
jgi:hypothetical protein